MMTQLNRVELCGYVGNSRVQNIGDTRIARFTVATNFAYKAQDGTVVIETQWSACVCFEKPGMENLDRLEKGTKIHLVGRLRNQRFTDASGDERTTTEILVSRFDIIEQEELLELQK